MRRTSTLTLLLHSYSQALPAALALAVLFTTSCGGGSMMATRQLQSIVVTPASAMASNGMVQFSAMGTFNMAPMTASTPVTWSLVASSSTMTVPAGVSIDANGLARCTGFSGMITVQAAAPMDPGMSMSQMGMNNMGVSGMAQLTCP